jgi:GNAT superfamily N-acetyltransferase
MNMYTVPEERGHGIATTLFQKMIEEGERAGVGKLVLHTTPTGRSLYRRFGFQEHNDEMVLTMKV